MSKKRLFELKLKFIDGDRGQNYPKKTELQTHGDCVFLNNKNLDNNGLNFGVCDYISKQKDDSLRAGKLEKGDLVLSTRGSIGNVGIYTEGHPNNVRINSCMIIVRNEDEKVDNNYLYHFFKSSFFRNQLNQIASGSIQKQLPVRDLKNITITIPSLQEQQKIANYLSNLDNQIELNNKINKELEEAAQTLYNYWFVQFEFPNEEGNPYKSSGGKMIWNEELKREIPVGWEVKNIKDIAKDIWGNCPPGKNILPKESNEEGVIPYCSGAGDMPNDSWVVRPKAKTDKPSRIVKEWDTLVSVAGTIGKTVFSTEEIAIGRATLGLQPIDYKHKSFIFLLMKSYCSRFNTVATGAIQKIINNTHLKEVNFAFNANLKEFEVLNDIYETILLNSRQNQELARLRDFMLPLLMNGQVTIED